MLNRSSFPFLSLVVLLNILFSRFAGFADLNEEDQKELQDKFGVLSKPNRKRKGGSMKSESTKAKQTKIDQTSNEQEEEQTNLKKVIHFLFIFSNLCSDLLKEQSELLWNYKDQLKNEVSVDILKELLELNNQMRVTGESNLIESVSDCLAFGGLQPCPECGGFLLFKSIYLFSQNLFLYFSKFSYTNYRCTGNVTEWTKCSYSTDLPDRKPFEIPDRIKEDCSIL